MEITVNQKPYQLETPCSVAQMLSLVNAPAKCIAVAINQVIVARGDWPTVVLQQDDRVMIIKATQGG